MLGTEDLTVYLIRSDYLMTHIKDVRNRPAPSNMEAVSAFSWVGALTTAALSDLPHGHLESGILNLAYSLGQSFSPPSEDCLPDGRTIGTHGLDAVVGLSCLSSA